MKQKRKYGHTPQGFSKKSEAQKEKQDARARHELPFLLFGFAHFIDYKDLEPDCFDFVQEHWDEGNELFDLLAAGNLTEAHDRLVNGPWANDELFGLVSEVDTWALLASTDRQMYGPNPTSPLQNILRRRGLEAYHDALMIKHSASSKAAETLGELLERETKWTVVDTGAMYEPNGEMTTKWRDLVLEGPGGTEVALQTTHTPRYQVKVADGSLPESFTTVIAQWGELVAEKDG